MNMQKAPLELITTTQALADICRDLSQEPYITVDTEFLRETTYYPKLCLIQVAGEKHVGLVDPLAEAIDLSPFLELMANESVLKVFHAARQDVEIILKMSGQVPKPIYDTQIAAMVCGFGDQVGYEAVARKLANASIDKSSQFTDWSRRPLTQKQLSYALSDVTHLRTVYEKLRDDIHERKRCTWLSGEMETLADAASYIVDPEKSWMRIKARIQHKKQQAVLMGVAAWREREAQNRNVPRGRILKDEAVGEIAIQMPRTADTLKQLRLLPKGMAEGVLGPAILAVIEQSLERDPATIPSPKSRGELLSPEAEAAAEIIKLALKIVADSAGIAPKLLASSADIEAIAMDDNADVPALQGWRREAFGSLAISLKKGKAAIAMDNGKANIFMR
jgi:ribonuclease D